MAPCARTTREDPCVDGLPLSSELSLRRRRRRRLETRVLDLVFLPPRSLPGIRISPSLLSLFFLC